jgi:hypothetical protein
VSTIDDRPQNNHETDAKYLDTCRNKRNVVEYDYVGGVSEDDVDELIAFVKELREEVIQWLRANHPKFLVGD